MNWTKISPEVQGTDYPYTIPYVHGKGGQAVDMFEQHRDIREIEFQLAVKKDRISEWTFDEIAVFIADEPWEKWDGQELGFRFPMDRGKDEMSFYIQHPWITSYKKLSKIEGNVSKGLLYLTSWFEKYHTIPNLDEYHTYKITLYPFWKFKFVIFRIDGKIQYTRFIENRNWSYLTVLTSHSKFDESFGFWLKLGSLTINGVRL